VARTEIERTVVASLLDRLTDHEPGVPADRNMSREDSVRAFRMAVERDVEWLLNTRRTMELAPESCPELHDSVYEFGLTDTTGLAVGTKAGRDRLINALRDALERFETRLGDPRVRLVEADQVRSPQVHFVVEAILRLEPSPEMVLFDTVLEIASGEYGVKASTESGGA
jgi:type VI secretion system protein ImpF